MTSHCADHVQFKFLRLVEAPDSAVASYSFYFSETNVVLSVHFQSCSLPVTFLLLRNLTLLLSSNAQLV